MVRGVKLLNSKVHAGVRAAKRISMSTCLGTYSGVLKTGLELLESAQ